MQVLTQEEIEQVSGGIYGNVSAYCAVSAIALGLSPLGGPSAMIGLGLNAWGACGNSDPSADGDGE